MAPRAGAKWRLRRCILLSLFPSVGLGGPPAITYLGLCAAGWPTYAAQGQAEAEAAVIRSSGLFDEARYAAHLKNSELDLALHYFLVGKQTDSGLFLSN